MYQGLHNALAAPAFACAAGAQVDPFGVSPAVAARSRAAAALGSGHIPGRMGAASGVPGGGLKPIHPTVSPEQQRNPLPLKLRRDRGCPAAR